MYYAMRRATVAKYFYILDFSSYYFVEVHFIFYISHFMHQVLILFFLRITITYYFIDVEYTKI